MTRASGGAAGEAFHALGLELERRWREQGQTPEGFPALAAAALREHDLATRLDAEAIAGWLLDADDPVRQTRVNIEYPFTVYRAEAFSIHAYFWVDGVVDVHDHAFWGAFQVLAGSSLQAHYRYRECERVGAALRVGELSAEGLERLRRGSICEIAAGREFIHGLFHLDRPSVTLLASTHDDPRSGPTFSYLRPGLAVDVLTRDERRERRLRALRLVAATWPDRHRAEVAKFVAGGSPDDAFFGLLHASETLDDEGLEDALEGARSAHGTLVDLWRQALDECRRRAHVAAARARAHDPTHRLFLAALLYASDPGAVLRLAADEAPGDDPVGTVVRWVAELQGGAAEGPGEPGPLGVSLSEAELFVLEGLMRGRGEGEIAGQLAPRLGATATACLDDVRDLAAAFRASPAFAALLPGGAGAPSK